MANKQPRPNSAHLQPVAEVFKDQRALSEHRQERIIQLLEEQERLRQEHKQQELQMLRSFFKVVCKLTEMKP